MKVHEKMKQIEGILSSGAFFAKGDFAFYLFFGVIFFVSAFLATWLSLDYVKAPSTDGIFVIIGVSILPSLLFSPLLVLLIKNIKVRKQVILWLEEAVEIEVIAKAIGVWNPTKVAPAVKIKIDFEVDGRQYSYVSTGKMIGGGVPAGYHTIWAKYADKKISILYSPKYEQVMVLKAQYVTNEEIE